MQRSKKTVPIAAGLAVIAMAGAALVYSGFRRSEAASDGDVPELLSEVPAGAPTLVYADLAAIPASTFYQQRPDRGPIALPDRHYAAFLHSTESDFQKDLSLLVLSSWPS